MPEINSKQSAISAQEFYLAMQEIGERLLRIEVALAELQRDTERDSAEAWIAIDELQRQVAMVLPAELRGAA